MMHSRAHCITSPRKEFSRCAEAEQSKMHFSLFSSLTHFVVFTVQINHFTSPRFDISFFSWASKCSHAKINWKMPKRSEFRLKIKASEKKSNETSAWKSPSFDVMKITAISMTPRWFEREFPSLMSQLMSFSHFRFVPQICFINFSSISCGLFASLCIFHVISHRGHRTTVLSLHWAWMFCKVYRKSISLGRFGGFLTTIFIVFLICSTFVTFPSALWLIFSSSFPSSQCAQ